MSLPALPPLCAASTELDHQATARYSRHLLLPEIGKAGQQRLCAARVLVIGAGGLGAPVLLYLAAAGVGCIGIVEFDEVELSNLQRQVLYRQADLGQPKIDSAAHTLQERYPQLKLELHATRLDASNALQLIAQYDLVLDGSDNFSTRYLVNDACVLADKPYVWGSIYRFEGQASVFWENAPDGRGVNYRDLYPSPPPPEFAPSCAEGGVLGVLCGVIGSVMATEAIKLICGIGEPLLGRLLTYNALQMRFRTLALQRAPERHAITSLQEISFSCALPQSHGTTELADEEQQLDPLQLLRMQESGLPHHLIDVRTQQERDIVCIAGASHMPQAQLLAAAQNGQLRKDQPLILHCKSGARSQALLPALQALGYHNVKNLEGGILAWIRKVQPELPRY